MTLTIVNNSFKLYIADCPRCRQEHNLLEFKPLSIAKTRFTHYAACPEGEPIFASKNMDSPDGYQLI